MLSRNNYQEKIRKMENKKERFSIRKFSIGAASVLIGFTAENNKEYKRLRKEIRNNNNNKTTTL